MMYYLARRYLSMTPEEWDGLPWWQQRLYVEGYEQEGLVESSEGGSASRDQGLVNESSSRSGGSTITDRSYHAAFSGVPGEMAAFGIPEQTIG